MKLQVRLRRNCLESPPGRKVEKIDHTDFDLPAAIGIGDEINFFGLVLEDEAFQDHWMRIHVFLYQLPLRRFFEKAFHTKRRAPVKVVCRIIAIADLRGYGNDALELVVA